MQVIHTASCLDPRLGGIPRSVGQMAAAYANLGIEVAVWTPKRQADEWVASLKRCDVELLSGELRRSLRGRSERLVVHDHGVWLPSNNQVARLTRRHKVVRVVSPRGMLEPWAISHRRWKKKIAWHLYQKRDLRSATFIHATAPTEASNLRRLGISQPLFVIPNGVELPPLDEMTIDRAKAPSLMDNAENTDGIRTAIFLGRIHPKKGLPMLIQAWSKARPAGWRMLVVGPDEQGHLAELKSMVAKHHLDSDWEFHASAYDHEKWRLLARADLMILPTFSENFGNVVPEALFVKTPVITTTGAPWESLPKIGCGWWIPPTCEAIEQSLREVCVLPTTTLRAMGHAGRAWAIEEFSWTKIAERMIAAYHVAFGANKTGDFI